MKRKILIKSWTQKNIPGRVRMLLKGSHFTNIFQRERNSGWAEFVRYFKIFEKSKNCKIFEKSKNCKICKNCRETFRGSISLKGSHTSMVGHSPSARAAQGGQGYFRRDLSWKLILNANCVKQNMEDSIEYDLAKTWRKRKEKGWAESVIFNILDLGSGSVQTQLTFPTTQHSSFPAAKTFHWSFNLKTTWLNWFPKCASVFLVFWRHQFPASQLWYICRISAVCKKCALTVRFTREEKFVSGKLLPLGMCKFADKSKGCKTEEIQKGQMEKSEQARGGFFGYN